MILSKTALIYKENQYSYDWLDQQTYCIAGRLYAAAKDQTIALMLHDPFEMALSLLAGLRTNLRIYLLHPASIVARVESLRIQGIPVINDLNMLPQPTVHPSEESKMSCALVFPTSNTTSNTTRWVEIPGCNMLKKAEMLRKMLCIREDDCSYLVSPLCFIQSCWAMLIHLTAGASVWIDTFSELPMLSALNSGRITTFITVPSIARTLVRKAQGIGSLRMLILGGDFSDRKLIENLRGRWPELKFGNVYGCTETAAADLVLGPIQLNSDENLCCSLGKPSCYSQVAIRDAGGQCVSPGIPGTIWIRSPFVCRNYLGSTVPLCDEDQWFCTNDMGCMDSNGYFYYLGRNASVIKYNGIKIAALEIESALLTLPEICEALAFPLPHELYGQIPACCVVIREGVTKESIQRSLQGILEPYKIPKAFFLTAQLPRTVSGKLCRNAEVIATLQEQLLE